MSSSPVRRRCSAILSIIFQARVLESKDAESCFYLVAAIGELLERDHPPHFHQLRYRDVILLRNPFDRVVADIVVHFSVFSSFQFNELFFREMPLGYLRTLARGFGKPQSSPVASEALAVASGYPCSPGPPRSTGSNRPFCWVL